MSVALFIHAWMPDLLEYYASDQLRKVDQNLTTSRQLHRYWSPLNGTKASLLNCQVDKFWKDVEWLLDIEFYCWFKLLKNYLLPVQQCFHLKIQFRRFFSVCCHKFGVGCKKFPDWGDKPLLAPINFCQFWQTVFLWICEP